MVKAASAAIGCTLWSYFNSNYSSCFVLFNQCLYLVHFYSAASYNAPNNSWIFWPSVFLAAVCSASFRRDCSHCATASSLFSLFSVMEVKIKIAPNHVFFFFLIQLNEWRQLFSIKEFGSTTVPYERRERFISPLGAIRLVWAAGCDSHSPKYKEVIALYCQVY